MIKLIDNDNNIVEFVHSIDAREALASGNFFEFEEVVKEVKKKDVKTEEEITKARVSKKTVKVPEPDEEEVVKEEESEEESDKEEEI